MYISPSTLEITCNVLFKTLEGTRWNWNDKYCLQKMVVSRRTPGPSNKDTVKLQQTLCGICYESACFGVNVFFVMQLNLVNKEFAYF